jgi:hypothetical protein
MTTTPTPPEPSLKSSTTVEIGVDPKTQKISYIINGAASPTGEIVIDRAGQTGAHQVKLSCSFGALAVYLERTKGNGDPINFKVEAAKQGDAVTIVVPPGAKKDDEYEYSLAVFTKGKVICADPPLRIFS